MIRKEKRRIAKQTKEKFQNITSFVNELHKKEPHTKRKTLICELTQHLYEEKFRQLRNELKKLIWMNYIAYVINLLVKLDKSI